MTTNENGDTTIALTVRTSMPHELVLALLNHASQLLEDAETAEKFAMHTMVAKADEMHRVIEQILETI